MPFVWVDVADAVEDAQAKLQGTHAEIIDGALAGTGWVSGCAVTAQGSPDMTVAVAAGEVRVDRVIVAVTSGNVTITTAHGSLDRIDLIVVDASGTKSAVAGTASTSPRMPALPSDSAALATVYVPSTDTTISTDQITDLRLTAAGPLITVDDVEPPTPSEHDIFINTTGLVTPSVPSVSMQTAFTLAEQTLANDTLQDDDYLFFTILADEIWAVQYTMFVGSTSNTPDIKYGITVPAGATYRLGGMGGIPTATTLDSDLRDASVTSGAIGFGANTGNDSMHLINAFIDNAGTAGLVKLQWAQNTANGTNIAVRIGCSFLAYRLA